MKPIPPVLVLAEVGSVHDGSFGNAQKLIEAGRDCGADAIKFQTHIAEAETLRNAPAPPYFKGERRYDYFVRTGFSPEEWTQLKKYCVEKGVEFMASPFSIAALDLLETVGVTRYKIPSGEVTNLPLLQAIARTGKPILLSSGMSWWRDLDEAVQTISSHHTQITMLQCTSQYPCPYEEVGLNVMLEMRERYRLPVGLSDHTLTPYASWAAVSLGASVIEKHLTFSRLMYGSDAAHSLEPAEFKTLVEGIRAIEVMLASPVNKDRAAVRLQEMKQIFEKSVVSLCRVAAGATLTAQMLGLKKPGTGIPARRLPEVIGRRAARDIPEDVILQEEDLHA